MGEVKVGVGLGGGWGGGRSLVMLPGQRPSFCTFLTGMKCVCEGF